MTPIDPESHPTECVLEAEVPAGRVVPPDVLPMACAGCGRRVMTSPSTRALVSRRLTRPACRQCMGAWAAAQGGTPILCVRLPAVPDGDRN